MCFDHDSRPPLRPIEGAAVDGRSVELRSSDGTPFRAYAAVPADPSGAGVVILPDVRGLHPFYEELALRFAENGVDAMAIDYFGRTAGTERRGPEFEHLPHVARTTYEGQVADTAAAADGLRGQRHVRALFTIGFCFGGRLAFLTGTREDLELSGVIGFYGSPVGPARNDMPPPIELADRIRCPVLGLFGGSDPGIPNDAVEGYRAALTEAGVDHELVVYPAAPHSFFDRKAADFQTESADAWERVTGFIRAHTPSS